MPNTNTDDLELKDILKKKEADKLTKEPDEEKVVEEIKEIMEVIDEAVESVDSIEYAKIHLESVVNILKETNHPLGLRLIGEIKSVIDRI